MPANYTGERTDYREAARILRGLQRQVNDIEESRAGKSDLIQLSRQVSETIAITDTVDVEVQPASGFVWNISKWDRRDWSDGTTTIPPIQDDDGSITAVHATVHEATDYTGTPASTERTGSTGQHKTGENLDTEEVVDDEGSVTPATGSPQPAADSVTTSGNEDEKQAVPADAINLNEQGLTAGDVIQDYWGHTQNMSVDPGRYVYKGSNKKTWDGFGLYGKGNYGDVVLYVEDGDESTTVTNRFEDGGGFHNITIEGETHSSKTNQRLAPGAHVSQYAWFGPLYGDGHDHHFFNPSGGADPFLVENSAWAKGHDNGSYTDKLPGTFRFCVARDNNIANIRVGCRDGTPTPNDHYVDDTVIASTEPAHATGSTKVNVRGLRLRAPTKCHVTNTLFDYHYDNPSSGLLVIHDGADASWSEVRLDHCVFYNATNSEAFKDKTSGSDFPIYIDGPVIVGGPGNLTTEGNIIDPDNNLTKDATMTQPDWDWRAVCRQEESPVAPYFADVSGDPATYP